MVDKLRKEINEYFVGKSDVVENLLICFLAGGHVLLEDVPGVGKTTLVRTLARAVDCSFGRIQFTPDTLPGDVLGMSVFNMKTNDFEYHEGALMHQIILADEINRTSPKTQSALLEAMAEGQITVDGNVYTLPDPFMVIATQNPVEFLGTYPLPEAQMDRFMMRLSLGYPDTEAELLMARNFVEGKRPDDITKIISMDEIKQMKAEVLKVQVNDAMLSYMQDIVGKSRQENAFVMGASPRALLFLVRASQAAAYLNGRDFVKPDDVKAVAVNVLHHRITLTPEARIVKESVDNILANIVIKAKVPIG